MSARKCQSPFLSSTHRRAGHSNAVAAVHRLFHGFEQAHCCPAIRGVRIGGTVLENRAGESFELALIRVAVAGEWRLPLLCSTFKCTDFTRPVIKRKKSPDLDASMLAVDNIPFRVIPTHLDGKFEMSPRSVFEVQQAMPGVLVTLLDEVGGHGGDIAGEKPERIKQMSAVS